jgi:hypothetical protein
MTSAQRATGTFAVLWVVLAVWQFVQTMRVCFDGTTTGILQWSLQLTLLVAPLLVLRRDAWNGNAVTDRHALALVILSYLPVILALRIAETCAHR